MTTPLYRPCACGHSLAAHIRPPRGHAFADSPGSHCRCCDCRSFRAPGFLSGLLGAVRQIGRRRRQLPKD